MEIKTNRVYKHFKGNLYLVLDTNITNSETHERMVLYEALFGEHQKYVRPYEMFASKVDKQKYPEVSQEYRFELQEDK